MMTPPANILIEHFFCGLVEVPAAVVCRTGHFWANLPLQERGTAVIFYQSQLPSAWQPRTLPV